MEAAGLNAAGDKKRQIVVTGCLAQRYGDSLAADLPEADLVMGFQAYGNLPAALADRLGVQPPAAAEAGSSSSSSSVLPTPSSSGRVQVGRWLKQLTPCCRGCIDQLLCVWTMLKTRMAGVMLYSETVAAAVARESSVTSLHCVTG